MPNDIETADSPAARSHPFFVVGLGASAGGVKPLTEFFSRVSPDGNMAYVVILHLSPEHESNLSALLQSRTSIPVTQVNSTVTVEPNHIYVIPPSKNLVMDDGLIRPVDLEPPRGVHTIDLCFRTLAQAYGKNAIAILLSGTGADGTLGIGRVKEEGGFVIAQDPAEAEYGDMPRNAINAGMVDLILPVAEMAAKVLSLRNNAERLEFAPEPEEVRAADGDEIALREVLTILRLRTGNDFTHYKRPTLLRRIARRMQVNELPDLNVYVEFIHTHPEEIPALQRDLLITITNFFRDADAFELLEKEVVPALFAGKGPNDQVRVWSAGCASGEEAYSLAILLAEYADQLPEPPRIQVFATDIDEHAISEARDCRYPATISIDVSPERLRRFFSRTGDHYQVKKELRETVLFAVHNVIRDPPFSRLDLITCRNLLIYLNRSMQDRVLEIFHFALRPNGFLFFGASESAETAAVDFGPIDKKRRIYKRRDSGGRPQTAPTLFSGRWPIRLPETHGEGDNVVSGGHLHQQVVEQFAPPSVLVDENYDVVHLSTHATRYLQISGGDPTHNLLKLVLPDLRLDLRSALLETKSREVPDGTHSRLITTRIDGKPRNVRLGVRAVRPSADESRLFFLVTFEETSDLVAEGPPSTSSRSGMETAHKLEEELQRTKEQLRVTIEQYETSTEELRASNEELQAINEELRSATEELETSKEELQSINEELTTVNQEYKEKIEEVGRINSDLQNLMAAIDIATIFLDRALQIKRYTPQIQQLFNITPLDIGRPLSHFTHQLDYPTLSDDAEEVLRSLRTIEREVHSAGDKWYLARLLPYRTIEDRIDGVVVTFVDITTRLREEAQLRQRTAELEERAEILNMAPAFILDENRRITMWNSRCESTYGFSAQEAIGKNAHELLKTVFPQTRAEVDAQLQRTRQWEGELIHTTRSGVQIVVASHWILHHDENRPPSILEMNIDVSARRRAEEALRDADRNTDRFLATLAHELRNPLGAIRNGLALVRRAGSDSAAARRAYQIVERQAGSLTRLVDDLVDVERLRHGQIRLQKSRIELRSVIDAAVEMSQPRIDEGGHHLQVTTPPQSVEFDGDLTRLAQVISNLLDNAAKYTPKGGNIEVSGERVANQITIKVRDSGMGIGAEMLPKLFELYAQGQPLPGRASQGFGVGLALVRQIVELHGGSVSAASDGPGRGSEFVVRLPVTSPAKDNKL
jgi:two-component system CheB/CheR fusion protein